MTVPSARMSGRDRRAQIYDVAARIFYENGYAATSVDQIAETVGILKGSLYYYINSKEDLLFHVIEQAHEGLYALLTDQEQLGGTVTEQLARMVASHVTYLCDHPIAIGVFFNDFRFLSEERRAIIISHRDTYDSRFRRLLEQGQAEGTFSADLDVKIVTFALLGMVNWLHQWYLSGGRLRPSEIADEFLQVVLRGILAKPREPLT